MEKELVKVGAEVRTSIPLRSGAASVPIQGQQPELDPGSGQCLVGMGTIPESIQTLGLGNVQVQVNPGSAVSAGVWSSSGVTSGIRIMAQVQWREVG